MSAFVGAARVAGPPATQPRHVRKGRPTKAQLLEEARGMGIDVPEGATIREIVSLIEDREG